MKTIYTLLLAFGLCLTSHAQNLQILTNTSNVQLSQMSQTDWDNFNDLVFSDTHTIELSDVPKHIYNSGTSVKVVTVKNVNGSILLNNYTSSLNDVKLLQLSWKANDVYTFGNNLNQKLPSLQYIYVNSYEMLNESNVETILGTLKNQFPNVKVIYQTLKDS